MFKAYILLFLLLHPTYLLSFGLPDKDGMYITGMDVSKSLDALAVVGYGQGSCEGAGDGFMIYSQGISMRQPYIKYCGLYFRSSAEAIAVYSESPLQVVITAEQHGESFLCEVDEDSGAVDCDVFKTPDFKKGRMAEVSGIDFDSRGRMYAHPDNGQYIFRYKARCAERGECKRDKEIKLPKYYHQMEDMSIEGCIDNPKDECIYIGDVGKGGTNDIIIYNLRTEQFSYKRFNKRKNVDTEAMTVYRDVEGTHIVLIHKDQQGSIEYQKY